MDQLSKHQSPSDHWSQWMEYLVFDEGLWAENLWEMAWTLEFFPEYLLWLDGRHWE